jgi:hypothetical protein
MHAAVAEFHRGQMAGTPPQLSELYAALERSWQSAGFLSRSHEEARHTAAQEAIARFRSEEIATGRAPAYVEKDFSFELGGHKIRGRWDRVDVQALPPEGRSAPIPTMMTMRAGSGRRSRSSCSSTRWLGALQRGASLTR